MERCGISVLKENAKFEIVERKMSPAAYCPFTYSVVIRKILIFSKERDDTRTTKSLSELHKLGRRLLVVIGAN